MSSPFLWFELLNSSIARFNFNPEPRHFDVIFTEGELYFGKWSYLDLSLSFTEKTIDHQSSEV